MLEYTVLEEVALQVCMKIVITEVGRLVSLSNGGVTLRLQYKHYNGGLLHLMDEDESFVVLGARRSPYI